jgi:hypothetical protein
MFNRIKNLIRLSELKPVVLEGEVVGLEQDKGLLGDGNAEFLGEGSSDEFKAQEEADKGFVGRIFGLDK